MSKVTLLQKENASFVTANFESLTTSVIRIGSTQYNTEVPIEAATPNEGETADEYLQRVIELMCSTLSDNTGDVFSTEANSDCPDGEVVTEDDDPNTIVYLPSIVSSKVAYNNLSLILNDGVSNIELPFTLAIISLLPTTYLEQNNLYL